VSDTKYRGTFIPNNPLALSFPRRRETNYSKNPRVAGRYRGFVRFAECITRWISACAGMTRFGSNEQAGFIPDNPLETNIVAGADFLAQVNQAPALTALAFQA